MAVIALDLGGTKLSAALFNDKGDILFKINHSLDKRQGTEVGELIFQAANELLSKANDVSAIGICVPGIAHAKTGKVGHQIFLAGMIILYWKNYSVRLTMKK